MLWVILFVFVVVLVVVLSSSLLVVVVDIVVVVVVVVVVVGVCQYMWTVPFIFLNPLLTNPPELGSLGKVCLFPHLPGEGC